MIGLLFLLLASAAFVKKRGKIDSNYLIRFIQTSTVQYGETPEYLKLLIVEMKTAICELSNLIQDLCANRI